MKSPKQLQIAHKSQRLVRLPLPQNPSTRLEPHSSRNFSNILLPIERKICNQRRWRLKVTIFTHIFSLPRTTGERGVRVKKNKKNFVSKSVQQNISSCSRFTVSVPATVTESPNSENFQLYYTMNTYSVSPHTMHRPLITFSRPHPPSLLLITHKSFFFFFTHTYVRVFWSGYATIWTLCSS